MVVVFDTEVDILAFSSTLLLLLLNIHSSLGQHVGADTDDDPIVSLDAFAPLGQGSILDANRIAATALQNFKFCIIFNLLNEDLGYWIKPQSTTWFRRFFISQYGEEQWIQIVPNDKTNGFYIK